MKSVLIFLKLTTACMGLLFFMNSCGNNNDPITVPSHDTAIIPNERADNTQLTDPQIASIAVTANQIDIDYAKIAEQKGSNNDVKNFAKTMAKDHQDVINQATSLAEKLKLVPENNATTQSLLDNAANVREKLNSLHGAEFDKFYIDNEVEYHKAAIDIVENVLIPNSTNAELKNLLSSALPLFKMHLEHAQKVQAEINK